MPFPTTLTIDGQTFTRESTPTSIEDTSTQYGNSSSTYYRVKSTQPPPTTPETEPDQQNLGSGGGSDTVDDAFDPSNINAN